MNIVANNYRELRALAEREARRNLNEYSSWSEDIAQEVMITLYEMESKGTLEELKVFGLCKQVAKLRALSMYAKETRRREIEQEIDLDPVQSAENMAADPLAIMEYEEMRERLDGLSPLIYITARLHYIDGLEVSSIAALGDVSDDVIYKRLQRARDYITNGEEDVR